MQLISLQEFATGTPILEKELTDPVRELGFHLGTKAVSLRSLQEWQGLLWQGWWAVTQGGSRAGGEGDPGRKVIEVRDYLLGKTG